MKIPILFDDRLLSCGIVSPIFLDTDKVVHAIAVGGSGSGKTFFAKLLTAKIALYDPEVELYICDAKGDRDFDFLNGDANSEKRFWRFTGCADGLLEFYNRLLSRQSGEDQTRNMLVLYCADWAALVGYLDKKLADEVKRQLSVILMLGRSFNMQVVLDMQRADAAHMPNGSRDNIGLVVGLGNLSDESKQMLFNDHRDRIRPDRRRGTGYCLQNGANLKACAVGRVGTEKLHRTIRLAVTR